MQGLLNEMTVFNAIPEDMKEVVRRMDELARLRLDGRPRTGRRLDDRHAGGPRRRVRAVRLVHAALT